MESTTDNNVNTGSESFRLQLSDELANRLQLNGTGKPPAPLFPPTPRTPASTNTSPPPSATRPIQIPASSCIITQLQQLPELPPDSPPASPVPSLSRQLPPPRRESLSRSPTAVTEGISTLTAAAAVAAASQEATDEPTEMSTVRRLSHTQRLSIKFYDNAGGIGNYGQHQQPQFNSHARRFSSSSTMWASEQENGDIEDDLTIAQRRLKDLKAKISAQSKRNFLLERDVRYLDSRIALLIQNRMALDEVVLADDERSAAATSAIDSSLVFPDEKKKRLYSQLFFLLQTDPRLVAHLTRLVKLGEIDTLLQTVMFTLYGNQYDSREEHLLLTMFQSVLIHEFDTALDFGSLMRANTPVSRMMTTYTRRGPGQQYLKYVLHHNLNQLLEQPDQNLEIDPLKVYEQLINQIETDTGKTCNWPRAVSADEAASRPEVAKLIGPRIQGLINLANRFLSTIIESLSEVPYGLRWICKQIRRLTKKKYPESSVWSICSLIGGFFFLRFVNPAIVTPQSYMIIDSQPGKTVRRTLTLLAKMLQNLANKPTHNKEMYMMQLSPFIEDNKERITKFLNDLCDVEDFYEVLELDQYIAMSKKDLSINISLNEIYNTHSLFAQHLDTICPPSSTTAGNNPPSVSSSLASSSGTLGRAIAQQAASPEYSYQQSCANLRAILLDLVVAPPQLPRAENKTITLPLYSRCEAAPILFSHMVDIISSKESLARPRDSTVPQNSLTDADILYMDTKSLIIQIMRKQFLLASTSSDSGAMSEMYENHLYVPVVSINNIPSFADDAVPIDEILEKAAHQTKDSQLIKKSLRAKQNLRILEDRYHHEMVRRSNGYQELSFDVYQEFKYLGELKLKLSAETSSLETVYRTICEHNKYLRSQLESYKAYLQNVRIQASGGGGMLGAKEGAGMIDTATASSTQSSTVYGNAKPSSPTSPTLPSAPSSSKCKRSGVGAPIKFSHNHLEKDGIILESGVPEKRRGNVYFSIKSPIPGTFIIGLHYKGRDKPIVEVDLKLDDLLEKQHDNIQRLDLEYVQLNVNKTLHLLNKHFLRR